jgi:hypothetical protein
VINPSVLIGRLVQELQDTPKILRHLENKPDRIRPYVDSPPQKSSLSREIYKMPVPSLLVAYMGTAPVGDEEKLAHSISVYVRARDSDNPKDATYASIITDIYNAIPVTSGIPLFSLNLTDDVEAMSIPTAQRIHDDEGSIDIFEIVTSVEELWSNFKGADES